MTVDNTSLLVALKRKPHPSDAGSEAVVDAAREERGVWSEEGRARSEEGRDERVVIEELGDYGARDIFAYVRPGETTGNVYLYLPNGKYEFKIGRAHYAATVNGLGTEAKLVSVDPEPPTTVSVTFGRELVHVTAAWTSGDGSVTNAISGTTFEVLKGTTGVKVIFTPEQDYRFAEVGETGVKELDSPLAEGREVTPPAVEAIPGTEANPWNVGDAVTAYVSDDGTLVISGTGAMDDFADAADAPWHERASEVSAVTAADGVTHIGKNAFAGFADTVKVNGIPSSFYRMMGGAYGMSSGQFPSGAISAGFESINIVDGTAYLGVAVKTNANLTAEAQDWGKVGLEAKDVSVKNGSVIIAVPANTEQGFFYLMSKPAVP